MSSKKNITIDQTALLNTSDNKHSIKRQKKTKLPSLNSTTVKQNLLQRIKDYKQREFEESKLSKTNEELVSQFKKSTNYLEELTKKKQEKIQKNTSKRKIPTIQQQHPLINPLLNHSILQPPVMQPPVMQPPVMQPSVMQPPVMQPSVMQPSVMQPSVMQPSVMQPPVMQPSVMQPSVMQPSVMQPSVMQPSVMQPPVMQPSVMQPPVMQPPVMQPPVMQPEIMQPAVPLVQFGNNSGDESFGNHADIEISLTLPPELQLNSKEIEADNEEATQNIEDTVSSQFKLNQDVPYGCLRNGNKPTFRVYSKNQNEFNKTFKKQQDNDVNQDCDVVMNESVQERQRKLKELQEKSNNIKIKKKVKQITTRKFKLGKNVEKNSVGVLIKSTNMRNEVNHDHGLLHRESINEIKKYLHSHGLIKIGSDAPTDVLRNIYVNAKLTGDVSNVNKQVMLHNFISDDEKRV